MNNLFSIDGKVAIVTGAAGYIGARLTKALLDFGASVVALDVKDFKQTVITNDTEQYERLYAKECDISIAESVKALYREVKEKFGHIDILVNCAVFGCGFDKTFPRDIRYMSDEKFTRGLEGTVTSAFRCSREVIPYMQERGGGSIINISSIYGVVSPDPKLYPANSPQKNPPDYGAGKAAILQLTRYFAADLARYNIRVNAITPGTFANPETSGAEDEEFIKGLKDRNMLGRIGLPQELCGALILLASDASSYMTGANIIVDGGWTAW